MRRDIDSIHVVVTSLTAFDIPDVFNVNIGGLKASPDENKKQLRALSSFFGLQQKHYTWFHFQFGTFMGANKIFVLFAVEKGTPVSEIRRKFLIDVLQPSAKGLSRHSRSDAHNISGFDLEDVSRSLRIFNDDWKHISKKIEEILECQTFQKDNNITKMFFYSALHGLQNSRGDRVGDAVIELIRGRLQIDINSTKILMVTADVSININSKDKEALLVDVSDMKALLKCKDIRPPMNMAVYEKYNIKGLSQFT